MNKALVPTEGKRSCPYQPTRSPSRQLQGSDTVNYALNHFPAKNGPDLRLLYCQMHEFEHPVQSDWRYS